jgi:hypothetical protein
LDNAVHALNSQKYDIPNFKGHLADMLLTDSGKLITVLCGDAGYSQFGYIDPDQKAVYFGSLPTEINEWNRWACKANGLVQIDTNRFKLFTGKQLTGSRLYSLDLKGLH